MISPTCQSSEHQDAINTNRRAEHFRHPKHTQAGSRTLFSLQAYKLNQAVSQAAQPDRCGAALQPRSNPDGLGEGGQRRKQGFGRGQRIRRD